MKVHNIFLDFFFFQNPNYSKFFFTFFEIHNFLKILNFRTDKKVEITQINQ